MNIEEANTINETFAKEHDLEYVTEGYCGFGRPCVGFTRNSKWIQYNPVNWKSEKYDYIVDSGNVYSPQGVTAYHKSDYLCVLKTECETALIKAVAGMILPFTAKTEEEVRSRAEEIEAMPDPVIPDESTNRAITELATWVEVLKERGTISIVEFDTGADKLQAILDGGTTGYAIVLKE